MSLDILKSETEVPKERHVRKLFCRIVKQQWGPISFHILDEGGNYLYTLLDVSQEHGVRIYPVLNLHKDFATGIYKDLVKVDNK